MNPVRSVFFWRVLIILIIALLLANVVSLAAYAYIGRNTYLSIEMDNLEPEAEITRQIYDEYRKGNLSEDGFTRLIDKQTIASQSAVLIADELGKTLIAITNLPPRKMMGLESCGMLLSAVRMVNGKEELHLVMLDNSIPVGSVLC